LSLDVYLQQEGESHTYTGLIFVRRDGQTVEMSREEWDREYPGREPVTIDRTDVNEVYSANITHNLNKMAGEAGIYEALWRPEEIGITKAGQLIEPLEKGLALMESDPGRFKAFNPKNGWGSYDGFVPWVEKYLSACREYPDADVCVSR
jgi:hypothetical protein